MPEYIIKELENARKEAEKYRLQAECYKLKMDDYKKGFRTIVNGYTNALRENIELKNKIDKLQEMALKEPINFRDYILCECLIQYIIRSNEVANAEK